jgi:predicted MFS family arabinose efflux permease
LSVIAIAALGCSCGASAEATQPMSGGTRAASASCVGLTALQEYRSARLVFDGKMLPGATAGATAGAGEHRVLSSPARVEVTRVSAIGWRSIFWINVPIGLAVIALTERFVPESKAPHGRRFDPAGQGLVMILLGSITAAIIEGPNHGWGSGLILGLFLVAVVAAAVLVFAELRRREPLVDPRFFRSPPFAGATLIALAAYASLGGFLFLNTLYLQNVRGYTALQAGLLTIPMAAMLGVFATVSGRLVASRGPRLSLALAGPALTVAALMFVALGVRTPVWYLIVAYLIFGTGSGLVAAPIANTALSGMPADQAGVAGAIASTSRQFGAALGVAVIGAIVAGSSRAEFTTASDGAWAVLAACGLATRARLDQAIRANHGKRARARAIEAEIATLDGERANLAGEAAAPAREEQALRLLDAAQGDRPLLSTVLQSRMIDLRRERPELGHEELRRHVLEAAESGCPLTLDEEAEQWHRGIYFGLEEQCEARAGSDGACRSEPGDEPPRPGAHARAQPPRWRLSADCRGADGRGRGQDASQDARQRPPVSVAFTARAEDPGGDQRAEARRSKRGRATAGPTPCPSQQPRGVARGVRARRRAGQLS